MRELERVRERLGRCGKVEGQERRRKDRKVSQDKITEFKVQLRYLLGGRYLRWYLLVRGVKT